MPDPLKQQPLLSAEAMGGLHKAKRQIMDAAQARVPERLLLATATAAVLLARKEATPREVLSARVVELVRESLKALAQQRWKPDTALLLKKRQGEL
jgi:hypothetical protein